VFLDNLQSYCYLSLESSVNKSRATIECEALAVHPPKEFYPDHKSLTALKDLKGSGGHLARWMHTTVPLYISVKTHGNADAMIRVPNPVFPALHQLVGNYLDTIQNCTSS